MHSSPELLPEALAFRFQHGPAARSLGEFRAIVAAAPPETVFFHREHFVPWVRDVLRDERLARRLAAYAGSPPAPDVYREIVLDLLARWMERA